MDFGNLTYVPRDYRLSWGCHGKGIIHKKSKNIFLRGNIDLKELKVSSHWSSPSEEGYETNFLFQSKRDSELFCIIPSTILLLY